MNRWFGHLILVLAAIGGAGVVVAETLPRCLFVSSYHQGYEWSDGVQAGIERVLEGRCQLQQFDMDTKRKKSKEDKQAAAERARTLIEAWKPDVMIIADDNAARYLVKPYYRDAELPIVFCGVNWSVDEYEFPYKNVTGMVEVAPLKPMLEQARELSSGSDFFYIGANTATERKNLSRFEDAAASMQLSISSRLVDNTQDWIDTYKDAQKHAFVVVGSHAGINDWDEKKARAAIGPFSKRLSVTNHGWMMPVTMLGFTKVPEEHGAWAAEAALSILDGLPASQIPIVANRKWDLWVNRSLLEDGGISLPRNLAIKAKQVD